MAAMQQHDPAAVATCASMHSCDMPASCRHHRCCLPPLFRAIPTVHSLNAAPVSTHAPSCAVLTSSALAKALMNSCDLPAMVRAWSRSARDNCAHTARGSNAAAAACGAGQEAGKVGARWNAGAGFSWKAGQCNASHSGHQHGACHSIKPLEQGRYSTRSRRYFRRNDSPRPLVTAAVTYHVAVRSRPLSALMASL